MIFFMIFRFKTLINSVITLGKTNKSPMGDSFGKNIRKSPNDFIRFYRFLRYLFSFIKATSRSAAPSQARGKLSFILCEVFPLIAN